MLDKFALGTFYFLNNFIIARIVRIPKIIINTIHNNSGIGTLLGGRDPRYIK